MTKRWSSRCRWRASESLLRAKGGRREWPTTGVLPLTSQGRLFIQKLQVRKVMKRHQRAAPLLPTDLRFGQLCAYLVRLPGPQAQHAVLTESDYSIEGGEELAITTAAAQGPGQNRTYAEEAGAAEKAASADRLLPPEYQGSHPPPTCASVVGILAAKHASVKIWSGPTAT